MDVIVLGTWMLCGKGWSLCGRYHGWDMDVGTDGVCVDIVRVGTWMLCGKGSTLRRCFRAECAQSFRPKRQHQHGCLHVVFCGATSGPRAELKAILALGAAPPSSRVFAVKAASCPLMKGAKSAEIFQAQQPFRAFKNPEPPGSPLPGSRRLRLKTASLESGLLAL